MFLECQVESDEGSQLHRHQCWELRLRPASNASFEVLHTPLSSSADPKAAGPSQVANSPATSAMTPLGPWDLLLVLQTKEVPVELPGQQWARIALAPTKASQRDHKMQDDTWYVYLCIYICIYILSMIIYAYLCKYVFIYIYIHIYTHYVYMFISISIYFAYHTVPYHTTPYHYLPCLTLPYLTWPYLPLPSLTLR